MDRLEQLVRATLAEHAEHAPAVLHRRHRHNRAWWAAGAAAIVVALAVGLAVARSSGGSRSEQPAQPAWELPAGYKPVSYHGIEVAVPSALPVVHWGWNCGPPTSSQIMAVNPEALSGCAARFGSASPSPAAGTYIELAPYGMSGLQANRALATEHVTVDAVAARLGYGTLPPYPGVTGVLALPQQDVLVTVTAQTRAVVATVLGSVRLAPVDVAGCPAREPKVAGNAVASSLTPAGATAVALCGYAGFSANHGTEFWLTGSLAYPADRVKALLTQLDALPSGSLAGTSPLHDYVGLRYSDGRMRWLSLSIGNSPDLIVSDGQHSKLLKENVAPWQLLYPATSWPEEAPW